MKSLKDLVNSNIYKSIKNASNIRLASRNLSELIPLLSVDELGKFVRNMAGRNHLDEQIEKTQSIREKFETFLAK